MSWREQAKAILEAGHVRHDRHNSSDLTPNVPNVPIVPGVVALDPARVLKVWHGRLAKLEPLQPSDGFGKSEWADLVDDSWWLYENFASVAVRQGWGAQGLWGVRVGIPHGGGLAQLLRTSRSVLFLDGIATVTRLGVQMKRNPECGHGCLLVWEVPHT